MKRSLKHILLIYLFLISFLGCKQNTAPECIIMSPNNHSEFYADENILISAEVYDKENNISKVDLFVNDNLFSSTYNFPYNFDINASKLNLGSNKITLKAIDDEGLECFCEIGIKILTPSKIDSNSIEFNAPYDIVLSNNIHHQETNQNLVGRFNSSTNGDSSHFNYYLIKGENSQHNNYFEIDGDQLLFKELSNISEMNIRVMTEDIYGNTFDKSFIIMVYSPFTYVFNISGTEHPWSLNPFYEYFGLPYWNEIHHMIEKTNDIPPENFEAELIPSFNDSYMYILINVLNYDFDNNANKNFTEYIDVYFSPDTIAKTNGQYDEKSFHLKMHKTPNNQLIGDRFEWSSISDSTRIAQWVNENNLIWDFVDTGDSHAYGIGFSLDALSWPDFVLLDVALNIEYSTGEKVRLNWKSPTGNQENNVDELGTLKINYY